MSIDDGLGRIAKGEVFDDSWNRLVYSVDSSHYQIMPEMVVFPTDEEDVAKVCRYCSSKQLPIGARGSGTGLLGQSLTDGAVLDFTKHMNRIVEIEQDYVIVQPGVVKAVLDRELKKKGKFLPPDPASSNYCSVGGMVANNSSGIHCLGYGNTIDFLLGVSVVYADGSKGYAEEGRFDKKFAMLRDLLFPMLDIIHRRFPTVNKNSCGYRLDSVVQEDKFLPHKILAASEGSLGLLTEAKFRILDLPEHRCLLVLGFSDLLAAVSAAPVILKFSPVALEMIDHTVVSSDRPGSGYGCILLVEFAGNRTLADRQLESCAHEMKSRCSVTEYASDESSLKRIWGARKGALNSIMKLTVGSRKPFGLIEDTVVQPEDLPDHVGALLKEYSRNKLEYVMYGHVGDGNLHTRPMVDLQSDAQMKMIEGIATRVFKRVVRRGGTITGEHGDGISRLPYIPMVYGRPIMKLFEQVKETFDPKYVLNPGKKIISRKLE